MTAETALSFVAPPQPQDPEWPGWQRLTEYVGAVAREAGFEQETSAGSGVTGFAISHDSTPLGAYGLVARQVYATPFWRIDKELPLWRATVAQNRFIPGSIDGEQAEVFYHFWRDRLLGDAPYRATKDGFALITLSGDLSVQRDGQICTPLQMVEQSLIYEPDRPITICLAPGTAYGDADMEALRRLDEGSQRVTIRIGDRKNLLRTCDYVVTQEGAVAFQACLFAKNPILFARTDARHIALEARLGKMEAFEKAVLHSPDYPRYTTWFLRDHAINVMEDDPRPAIARRLRACGWPIPATLSSV